MKIYRSTREDAIGESRLDSPRESRHLPATTTVDSGKPTQQLSWNKISAQCSITVTTIQRTERSKCSNGSRRFAPFSPAGLEHLEHLEPSPFNGLNPSALLRTSSAQRLNNLNVLNGVGSRRLEPLELLELSERLTHRPLEHLDPTTAPLIDVEPLNDFQA